jgi:hypothetical protein
MRKVFRSKENSVGIALFGGISSVLIVADAIAIDSPNVSLPERVAWIAIGFGWGAFCILRAARAGVYVLPEGIKIVNPFRTKFVPWRQIARFSLRRWGPFPLMGHIDLANQSSEHIFGIEAPNPLIYRDAHARGDPPTSAVLLTRPRSRLTGTTGSG